MVSTQDVRPSYLEIKTTYRNTIKDATQDKLDYKQRHYHNYSVITVDKYLDEEYARHMIIDIYAQYNKKEKQRKGTTFLSNHPTPQLPHQNGFMVFMIQHHAKKFTKIMKDAGVPLQ
eukprot:5436201-Amphidinium_carterae.1